MEPRSFGTTGLDVTPIGLGLAALGRPGYLTIGHEQDLPADRSVVSLATHATGMLDHAEARGVRYLDVARSYGRAESFLGAWLRSEAGRIERHTVGSKWGYTYTAGWRVDAAQHEVKDHGLATFARQLAETRAELGAALDVYLVHSATLDSGILDDAEVLRALTDLGTTGVVVGLSLSGPGQAATLRRALELAASGRAPFRAVQATWNLLEPSVGPVLVEAKAAGWGVALKEVVANGRLAGRLPVPDPVRAVAAEHDVGPDAIAIAAALAQPFTDVVISGAVTSAQLDANLRGVAVTLREADQDRLAVVVEEPASYWAARAALPWT